jgi:hypothetical protein
MNDQDKKRGADNMVLTFCMAMGMVVGSSIFQGVAPKIFPSSPNGGINTSRIIWAGAVGGGSSIVGAGIGILINKVRKSLNRD